MVSLRFSTAMPDIDQVLLDLEPKVINRMDRFWKIELSKKYEEFALSVPSDIPAYEVVYHLLKPRGKVILDFGCFQGKSSAHLVIKGASKVLGIDNSKQHIDLARQYYAGMPNLSFLHVPKDSFIQSEEDFDAVSMTFVHPTIGSINELKFQVKKIYQILSAGGKIVLLGLHPNSLEQSFEFLFYTLKLSNGNKCGDGRTFQNQIRLPNGHVLNLIDYLWENDTLVAILHKAGFLLKGIYELKWSLDDDIGEILRNAISQVSDSKINWKDE